jgi:DHA2 family multidrug resistance protein-like MFS transporter
MGPMLKTRDTDSGDDPARAAPASDGGPAADGLPFPRRYWAIAAISFGTAVLVLDGAIAQ